MGNRIQEILLIITEQALWQYRISMVFINQDFTLEQMDPSAVRRTWSSTPPPTISEVVEQERRRTSQFSFFQLQLNHKTLSTKQRTWKTQQPICNNTSLLRLRLEIIIFLIKLLRMQSRFQICLIGKWFRTISLICKLMRFRFIVSMGVPIPKTIYIHHLSIYRRWCRCRRIIPWRRRRSSMDGRIRKVRRLMEWSWRHQW